MNPFKHPDRFLMAATRRQKFLFFLLLDTLFVPMSLALTLAMAPLPWNAPTTGMVILVAGPALALIGAVLLISLRIPSLQLADFDGDAILRVGAVSAALATFGTAMAAFADVSLPKSAYFIFAMVLWLSIAVSRVVMLQIVLAIYRRSSGAIRVLIYGAGTTGTQLVQAFRSHYDIDPVAFLDDNPALQGLTISGLPVYTPVRVAEIAKEKRINRVLLAVPSLSPPRQARIARRLQKLGLEVQSLPSFSQLIGTEALIDRFETLKPKMFLNRDEVKGPLIDGSESYTGKSVMVSGAGGSIGSELCRQLLEQRPRRLVLFELSEIALFSVQQELKGAAEEQQVELVPVLGSVTDPRQVRQVLSEHVVEVVLHAAAYKHVSLVQQNPLAGIANNVLGTQTLATAVVEAGVERFILVSSDKAVRPKGVMGATKRLAELVIEDIARRSSNKDTVLSTVRFGNVLGSSGSVVPIFNDQIKRGGPVTVTHPHVTRYFMTIEEAARLVLRAGSMAEGGEIFLLDMGEPVKILDLAIQSIEAAGYTVQSEDNANGDISIRFTGLQPGEKLHEELFFDGSERPTSHRKIFCVREAGLSQLEIARMLRSLRQALASGDTASAIAVLSETVEGFGQDLKTVPPITLRPMSAPPRDI